MDEPRRLRRPQDSSGLVVDAAVRDPAAVDACRRLLLPLRRLDAQRSSDLERTLATYYACGCSVSATADALFLHRNSVRYRLDRVRALLGVDIDHPDVSSAMLTAFAVDRAASAREETRRATERSQ